MRLGLLTSAAAVAVALALAGCGSRDRTVVNLPPQVEITGSPVEGDSVNYVVDLYWHSWDDDGVVVRSEYAVDIPPEFTPDQIADPATPGIEWTPTADSHVRIRFRAAPPESLDTGSGTYPTDSSSAPHTCFVRSYDNEGAHSIVAERSFNAWTALPRTTITEPVQSPIGPPRAYYAAGRSLTVRWSALDPDGRAPEYGVVRTEYKLIPIATVYVTDPDYVVHIDPGPNLPWIRVLGDSGVVTLNLTTPRVYLLALRSIDEAGGVESRFEFWRNALIISAGAACFTGRPTLTVREPTLGSQVFPPDGSYVYHEVFAGQCLNFKMSADAQVYGGVIEAYRWCIDSEEGPMNVGVADACVPWGTSSILPPVCFEAVGLHTVDFAVRTAPPCVNIVSGTLRLNIIPGYFDRDVLYIDDIFNPATDAETDRRFLTALRGAGFETIDSYSAWGEGDRNGAVDQPTLALFSRYRMIFWAVSGAGGGSQNGVTALLQASACPVKRILRGYVAAGGGVWIHGETVFGALKNRNNRGGGLCLSSLYSNDTGLNFAPGDFVTDYQHLQGGDIRDAKTGSTSDGLLRAHPTARALGEGFPVLEADSTTYAFASLGGLPFYDAMFQPTLSSETGMDTLYTAEPVRGASAFNGKPIAWRYADPSATPRQGPVAITSFPLQKMKEGAPSRVVDGVRVPGTGLNGLVEVMRAWFLAHDATGGGT